MASPVEEAALSSEEVVLSSEDAVLSSEATDVLLSLLVSPPTTVLAEVQPASAESVSRPASAKAQSFLSFILFYPFVLYKNRENFGGFCCRRAINIAHGVIKIKRQTRRILNWAGNGKRREASRLKFYA